MESEIKLAFKTKEDLFGIIEKDWFSDYCLDTSEKEAVRLENTYFDTPDRILFIKGASIRVRSFEDDDGICYEHTVKYGGTVSGGLHQRYEWNVRSDSGRFDISSFKKEAANTSDDPIELLDEILEGVDEESLIPLCSTEFDRTRYMFGFGDSIMEACFDCGKIIAGDRSEDICELELELESGDVVDLKEMGQFIVENTSAVPFNDSKFKRCLKLLSGNE